ncbi:MAG: hypothetical protein IPJ69_11890 [Deltaproteobacteria bacterium]|nr:MAG: hypothetical protein IPJ69_11890 [Deltaproteobacteria bacterium]
MGDVRVHCEIRRHGNPHEVNFEDLSVRRSDGDESSAVFGEIRDLFSRYPDSDVVCNGVQATTTGRLDLNAVSEMAHALVRPDPETRDQRTVSVYAGGTFFSTPSTGRVPTYRTFAVTAGARGPVQVFPHGIVLTMGMRLTAGHNQALSPYDDLARVTADYEPGHFARGVGEQGGMFLIAGEVGIQLPSVSVFGFSLNIFPYVGYQSGPTISVYDQPPAPGGPIGPAVDLVPAGISYGVDAAISVCIPTHSLLSGCVEAGGGVGNFGPHLLTSANATLRFE